MSEQEPFVGNLYALESEPLPEGWSVMRLAEACSLVVDGTHGTHERHTQGIPLLSAANIQDGALRIDPRGSFVTEEEAAKIHAKWSPTEGDVLVTVVGSLGRSCMVKASDGRFAIQRSVALLRPRPDVLHSQFLEALVRTEYFQTQLRRRANTTAQSGVYLGELSAIPVPVPPLEEQRRIAQLLGSIDALTAAAGSEAAALEAQVPALLLHFLRDPKASTPSGLKQGIEGAIEFPQEWPTVRLEEISTHITKGSTPTTYGHEWATQDDGIPFFRSECVKPGRFIKQGVAFIPPEAHDEMKRSHVRAGDILVSITGYFGNVCIVPDAYETANINQHIARVRIKPSPEINPRYVYWAMRDPRHVRLLQRIQTGQAYPQIGLREVRDITIPMPPRNIQDGIAATLEAMETRAGAVAAIGNALTTLKTGLLQDLLIGDKKADTVEVTT